MNHRYIITLLLIALNFFAFSQIRLEGVQQADINPALYTKAWQAHWISLPDEPVDTFGIYHFRKTFDIEEEYKKFIVHVSADNRYKLYVNGQLVSLGPARSDILNWNFETIDLASYLHKGKNVLAAVVWNYGDKKPLGQMSFNQTGFIVQGNTAVEEILNTNETWLVTKNRAYNTREAPVYGYYVAGPGEMFHADAYPWGWERPDFDDSHWVKAQPALTGSMKGGADYPGRLLVPRPIPPMEYTTERFQKVRKVVGGILPNEFPLEKKSFVIPAHTKIHFILDQGYLTTGYLSVQFGKGKDASIRLGYAEAFYSDVQTGAKGNRDEIDGKTFIGYEDILLADGEKNRDFVSLWWRTWRYLDVHVETKEEELTIDDIHGIFSAYPFDRVTEFSAPGQEYLSKMLDIGWRTARLCANETYMDCPYYEQLQYFGDTRIQSMISLYNTRDIHLVKNAIEQGRQSLVADGITMGSYPRNSHQFISSFSLWWIGMGHDYWRYRGNEDYLKSLLPAYRNVLAWYEQLLKPDHSLSYIPYWFFADWAEGFPNGEPVRDANGNSALQDLLYILALEWGSEMEEAFGLPEMAKHYQRIADAMKRNVMSKFWNESRHLFADTYDHRSYSQHVNSLAILAGLVTDEQAKSVMQHTLEDKDLIQTTVYFRYYLNQALNRAGLGDELLDHLQVWEDQMTLGLTTWAERPEPSRSDCHAWGASLNVEFYRILLGVDSAAPGFRKVRIAPSLGKLRSVSGSVPHPLGIITVKYHIDKQGELRADIDLPTGLNGTFVWKGKVYDLKGGKQTLRVS